MSDESSSRKRKRSEADSARRLAVKEDCYGFSRDKFGRAKFVEIADASQVTSLTAVEARTIAEVSLPRGGLSLPTPVADFAGAEERRVEYIITSPNMPWIPDISLQKYDVVVMENGRFGYNDFTIWPQFYFPETRHLAFTRSKPSTFDLPTHEYRVLWHDLSPTDFVYEQGGLLSSIGRITDQLHVQLMEVRRKITAQIRETLNDDTLALTPAQIRTLSMCELGMRLTSVAIHVAPQPYFTILMTFCFFQRHALEALACLDMLHIWENRIRDAPDMPLLDNVDGSIIGAVTWEPTVAIELHSVGVPVWLVRAPQHVPSTIRILEVSSPMPLSADISSTTPHTPIISYCSAPASPVKIRTCLSLHLGHVHLGGIGGGTSGPVLPSAVPVTAATSSIQSPGGRVPFNGLVTVRQLFPVARKDVRNISTAKYKEPECSFAPQILPTWESALKQTPQMPQIVYNHTDLPTFRGYSLMDPYILAKDSSFADRALITWLYIRSAWIAKVSLEWPHDHPFPLSQDWRNLVIAVSRRFGLLTDIPSGSRLVAEVESVNKFPIQIPSVLSQHDLYWRGSVILAAGDFTRNPLPISAAIRREILWDLFEQNFRLEVFALDKCIVYRRDLPNELATSRDGFVMNMFPGGLLVSAGILDESVGSGSLSSQAVALNNFRRILMGWGSCSVRLHPERFKLDASASASLVEELGRLAFGIYCEQFFLHFGRPPIVPHMRPF